MSSGNSSVYPTIDVAVNPLYCTDIVPVQLILDAAEVNYIPFLEWEKDWPDTWVSLIV
mgnify:CR=1 FL=1